jgi:hypothetical protein
VEVQKAADFDNFTSILALLVLKTDSPYSPLSASLIAAAGPAAATLQPYLFVQGRALCITQQGRISNYMSKIEIGDVIAALRGGHRLYVLRLVGGGRYRVVGDAYVDSLMFSEAYEGLDPDEVDYDIELI